MDPSDSRTGFRRADETPRSRPALPPRRADSVKPKVLLVDDAPNVRSALAAMLAPRYSVSTAADPAEAVALLERTGGVPVIVTDYQMPGGNGVELMQRVHA